ncbi:MAG: beta-ketoacyl-ACP synthase I [Gammaproteobacteria bacterium]|nr:beta-ketoacyl-ACP synthase I [Gammaproteobacteria bacterium]
MKRVVLTGLGIVSCLGNDEDTVADALLKGRSGIRAIPEYAELGLRSHVAGAPEIDLDALIDRRDRRFMGDAAAYSHVAMGRAITDSGLDASVVSHPRTGLIAGSGGGSPGNQIEAADILRSRGIKRVGPYRVPRTMCSTIPACLATSYRIKGLSYAISSACATSAHCIGAAMEQIQLGRQDVVFAGGGDELHWGLTCLFDAMGALSSAYNATPERASRTYDANRDGFVIAGGAGMVVLESLEHAQARGARIRAELVGYGVTSDGADMVAPSGEGAVRCMRQALEMCGGQSVGYLNTHGTSTPAGDIVELKAIREVFGERVPPISSTKSLTGHSLGGAGVQEAIYSLLMMERGFLAASANIETLDPEAEGFPILREAQRTQVDTVMSNSFGFGGTNATLIFRRWRG